MAVTVRMSQMWNRLSLRTRLFLPLGVMFAAALIMGAVSLDIFTTTQLIDENEPSARSVGLVADALNNALKASADPRRALDAFGQSLGTSEAIQFRHVGAASETQPPVRARTPFGNVPGWFVRLLNIPDVGKSYSIAIEGEHVGDVVFSPDLSPDIFEKWMGFLAIAVSGIALTLLTGIIAYFAAGTALRPLERLGEGLTRMRKGDYDNLIQVGGPPEIRKSCEEANELARTLARLSHDNRSLLRKFVSLQDDDRRDLARELHDELGPLLFGIRANSIALLEAAPHDKEQLDFSAQGLVQSIEALQQANRRILDRLRPLYIQELGLEKSIQTLLRNAQAQAPAMRLTAGIDPRLSGVDGLLSQTVYRVIQEAVTNVLRHAQAHSINVAASIEIDQLVVEVSDDGVGFPQPGGFGRGLTGMHERIRALSGTFQFLREGGRTYVRCRLPVGEILP